MKYILTISLLIFSFSSFSQEVTDWGSIGSQGVVIQQQNPVNNTAMLVWFAAAFTMLFFGIWFRFRGKYYEDKQIGVKKAGTEHKMVASYQASLAFFFLSLVSFVMWVQNDGFVPIIDFVKLIL